MKTTVCADAEGDLVVSEGTSGRLIRVEWKQGRIRRILPEAGDPDAYPSLMPSLIDLQVNGYGGVDFQNPAITGEELTHAIRALARDGCGGCLVTLITDDWEAMLGKLRHLIRLRSESAELERAILGWHLEGPFLSEEEGFRGAHDAFPMRDPTPRDLDQLLAVVGKMPVMLTLAPERSGCVAFIEAAVQAGIRVSLGHSAASALELASAVRAGAQGITHFGNGCPQNWPRHDNWFWSVVDQKGLCVGLIPDGIHLPGPVFRGMHHALSGRNAVYYTTDAMAAAGAGPGIYRLGEHSLEVGTDEVVRRPGQPNYAGSALRPLEGVRRAVEMTGDPWKGVWDRYSQVPAAFMGFDLDLRVGKPVNFCVVEDSVGEEFHGVSVYSAELPT